MRLSALVCVLCLVVISPVAAQPPQAKTQAEFVEYNSAYSLKGGAVAERAADDFVARFPASELRAFLYSKAMHEYQNENDAAGMLRTGDKVLAIDPSDTIALVLTATVMSDGLEATGDGRAIAIEQVKIRAGRALQLADSSHIGEARGEQLAAYRSTLKSMAHSALGIVALKTEDFAAAESHLQQAAELNTGSPDPYIWYHLSLAEDHLSKYQAALDAVTKALTSSPDAELARQAEGERRRLELKLGSAKSH